MEYGQRVVITFLLDERADTHDIRERLQERFTEHASTLQKVQFWIVEIWLGHQDLHDEICTRRPPLADLDAKIMMIIDKSHFKSIRSIAEKLSLADSKVLLDLYDSVGFRSFLLHSLLHRLKHDLCEKRMEYAHAMPPVLYIAEREGWYHIVTGNESWSFLNR
jgi:hypothetical protein